MKISNDLLIRGWLYFSATAIKCTVEDLSNESEEEQQRNNNVHQPYQWWSN